MLVGLIAIASCVADSLSEVSQDLGELSQDLGALS